MVFKAVETIVPSKQATIIPKAKPTMIILRVLGSTLVLLTDVLISSVIQHPQNMLMTQQALIFKFVDASTKRMIEYIHL